LSKCLSFFLAAGVGVAGFQAAVAVVSDDRDAFSAAGAFPVRAGIAGVDAKFIGEKGVDRFPFSFIVYENAGVRDGYIGGGDIDFRHFGEVILRTEKRKSRQSTRCEPFHEKTPMGLGCWDTRHGHMLFMRLQEPLNENYSTDLRDFYE